jgi:hypothetical protein
MNKLLIGESRASSDVPSLGSSFLSRETDDDEAFLLRLNFVLRTRGEEAFEDFCWSFNIVTFL